ncbi:hypothetical protein JW859_04415 [bacterium]|nr:hypothetical protein [bacterium]
MAILLCGCAGGPAGINPEAGIPLSSGTDLGPLPQAPHIASATETVNGEDCDACGDGVTTDPPAALFDASGRPFCWARYGCGLPEDGTFNSVSLDVESVNGAYWVALACYAADMWEWHGPYTDDSLVEPTGSPEDYRSGTDNLYWVVCAVAEAGLRLVSSTVDYDWDPPVTYNVPPSGQLTITTEPAAYPSLILLPAIEGVAQEGAPLVFYTRGEETSADTYVAYYDGSAWQERKLFPDGPRVLLAVVRSPGPHSTIMAMVGAYDTEGDAARIFVLDTDLALLSTMSASSNPSGTITHIAMDCVDTATWCIAQVRNTATGSAVSASYEDMTDMLKTPYDAVLVDETVAGLDVCYDAVKPVVAYSHGTAETEGTLLLDFEVTLTTPQWTTTKADYNSPLTLDLHYDDAFGMQLLMVSGRDFHIAFPISFTATLYFDAVLGTLAGETWTFDTIYEGDLGLDFIHSEIDVDMAADVAWADMGALSIANVTGTLGYSLADGFEITGGTLSNTSRYYEKLGGGYGETSYFTGAPGVQMSWQVGAGGPGCAYIKAETAEIEDIIAGTAASGELLYWSPAG